MIEKENIYYSWNGENVNIPNYLCQNKIIPTLMNQISLNNKYSCTLKQYENFCQEALNLSNNNCFQSIFLYTINDILVAFLNLRITFSDAEIDFICVEPNYRRKKIAENLFDFFEKKILLEKKISKIFLEVGTQNETAIKFYEKLNFKKISIRKKYYKNEEDAYVMEKICC
jgi:ribosomal-protein-alanine N-acetyltransferase